MTITNMAMQKSLVVVILFVSMVTSKPSYKNDHDALGMCSIRVDAICIDSRRKRIYVLIEVLCNSSVTLPFWKSELLNQLREINRITLYYDSFIHSFHFISFFLNSKERECPIAVTEDRDSCKALRLRDIEVARRWYQLTDANTKTSMNFPYKNLIPWLNQTMGAAEYHFATDPFESRYMMLLFTIKTAVTAQIAPFLMRSFHSFPFVSNQEYVALHNAWNGALNVQNHFLLTCFL